MSHERDLHSFAYVECDIPPGMTIAQWRAQRAGERPAATRQRPIAVAGRRVGQAADWIRRAGTRALARAEDRTRSRARQPASGTAPRGALKPREPA